MSSKSQYHHYVPRFILRNYRFNEIHNVQYKNRKRKSGKAQAQKAKDGQVRQVDLKTGDLIEPLLSKTFGVEDMYKSFTEGHKDPYDLEDRLSKLEARAGDIFARIRTDYEAGRLQTTLSRSEKNELCRFMFLMLYRNKSFHARFNISKEQYDCDDRDDFLAYMEEKNFSRPIDVWFHNIRAFLDFDLNREGPNWLPEIQAMAYPWDALWFFKNMQWSYIAIIRPENLSAEFILSQNAYSVFEGPASFVGWMDYHTFAPISPRLLIVSRSFLLNNEDDHIESSRQIRELLAAAVRNMHLDPSSAGSILQDLPIRRADNNYSQLVNGRREAISTQMRWSKYTYTFSFFPVPDKHVHLINAIFLDNAASTSSFIYHEPEALKSTLEYYLRLDMRGFKAAAMDTSKVDLSRNVIIEPKTDASCGPSIAYLETLEAAARKLGSDVSVTNVTQAGKLITLLPVLEGDASRRYISLGGSVDGFMFDWMQSTKMVTLIIKTDSLARNASNESRNKMRKTREEFFDAFPPQRVWLMLKNLRELPDISPEEYILPNGSRLNVYGIEDAFADAFSLFNSTQKFCQILQRASKLESFRERNPTIGLVGDITFDEKGRDSLVQELNMMRQCGNIADCGIQQIRESAQKCAFTLGPIISRLLNDTYERRFLTRVMGEEQHVETIVRQCVAASFMDLKLELSLEHHQNLREALFEICFPYKIGRTAS